MLHIFFSPKNKKLSLGLVFVFSPFLLMVFSTLTLAASGCFSEKVPGTNRPVSCRVDPGSANALEIPADGCTPDCKKITHNCPDPIFIPLNTCPEWYAFLANRPVCVSPPAECQRTLTVSKSGTGPVQAEIR